MAGRKIKFTGVIKRFGGKSGGQEIVFGKVKSGDPKQLLEMAVAKEKNKEKVSVTIELIQQSFPETT